MDAKSQGTAGGANLIDAQETTPLLSSAPPVAQSSTVQTKVFWYRWYVLLVYCCLVTQQGAVWNHWGPISDSVQEAFHWSDTTLGLLPFWGPCTYVVSFYPWTVFMRSHGLRFSGILSASFVAAGCLFKAIPLYSDHMSTIMCHVCAIINGFAGPVVTAACTKLAAEWFPMNERVTAVAIATMSQSLGPTLSFLIGPHVVEDLNANLTVSSASYNASIKDIKHEVATYNYIDLGVSGLILLLILVYFPNKPRQPPSISSQMIRSIDKGVYDLDLNTWLAVLAFGMPNGITNAYSAVFNINMMAYGVSQDQSDWMGFSSSAASMLMILIAGRLVDCFRRPRMAALSTVLLILSTLAFAWFTVMCDFPILRCIQALYICNILGNALQTATTPLFYELTCESAFPASEETTTMVVTTCSNVFSGLFLAVLFIPAAGTKWMNYTATASCLLAIPLVVYFKEEYRRRQYDLQELDGSGNVQA